MTIEAPTGERTHSGKALEGSTYEGSPEYRLFSMRPNEPPRTAEQQLELLESWIDMIDEGLTQSKPGFNIKKFEAARHLLYHVFADLPEVDTTRIFAEWCFFARMDRYTHQTNTDAVLAQVLGQIDPQSAITANATFAEAVNSLHTDPDEQNIHFYKHAALLALLLTIAEKPYEKNHVDVLRSKVAMRAFYPVLLRRAEYMIARLVLQDLRSGAFEYQLIDRRYVPFFEDFLNGLWGEDLTDQYDIKFADSTRKTAINDVMHQLLFGQPAAIGSAARARYVYERGEDESMDTIDSFVRAVFSDELDVPATQSPGQASRAECKTFARAWLDASEAQKKEIVQTLRQPGPALTTGDVGTLRRISEILNVSYPRTTQFFVLFDFYALEGIPTETIFSDDFDVQRRKKIAGFADSAEAAQRFAMTLQRVQYIPILPESSHAVLDFMKRYVEAIQEGRTKIDDIISVIETRGRFHVTRSYLLAYMTRAAIFCDLVERITHFPPEEQVDNPIIRAWMLACLAEHIHDRASKRSSQRKAKPKKPARPKTAQPHLAPESRRAALAEEPTETVVDLTISPNDENLLKSIAAKIAKAGLGEVKVSQTEQALGQFPWAKNVRIAGPGAHTVGAVWEAGQRALDEEGDLGVRGEGLKAKRQEAIERAIEELTG